MSKRPRFMEAMEPTVFLGSASLVIGFLIFGSFFTETAANLFNATQAFIAETFGWFYILSVSLFVGFVIWLWFSPYGDIRLGDDDSRPEFSYFAWFTMLFSAGMGIGLVFWGIAEPITHYLAPPTVEAETPEAVLEAMRTTFFHWGFHPWAVYIIFGLAIAYYHFRHGLPLAPRSLLYPVLGEKFRGILGHLMDILCTVGTLFGVATSLGLGAMQINAGISEFTGLAQATDVQIIIIVVITLIATISVVSGVENGIRLLSEFNVILACVLLLFVFVFGPTLFQLKMFASTLGDYLQHFVEKSFWIDMREGSNWQTGWTLFYWGWWISWSPFVGVFIARISKSRTVREFVLNVFLAPTLATFVWLAVFGPAHRDVRCRGPGRSCEGERGAFFSHGAEPAALGFGDVGAGYTAGDNLFYYVVGFRIAGGRYGDIGRAPGPAHVAADFLGVFRGGGSGSAALFWRAQGAADGVYHLGAADYRGAPCCLLRPGEGTENRL